MPYQPHKLRIQLSRKKGYRKPAGAILVARPTRWGNPFQADPAKGYSPEQTVADFRRWVTRAPGARSLDAMAGAPPKIDEVIEELRGKQLACWCPLDRPCHADVLCELANIIRY